MHIRERPRRQAPAGPLPWSSWSGPSGRTAEPHGGPPTPPPLLTWLPGRSPDGSVGRRALPAGHAPDQRLAFARDFGPPASLFPDASRRSLVARWRIAPCHTAIRLASARSRRFSRRSISRRAFGVMLASTRSSGSCGSHGSRRPAEIAARMPAVPPRTRVVTRRAHRTAPPRPRTAPRRRAMSRRHHVIRADARTRPLGQHGERRQTREPIYREPLHRPEDRDARGLYRVDALQRAP